jgi:hypothetical protein
LKYIYIGTINRSGGSLLTRLFDGQQGIASYPLEWDWHLDKKLYPFYVALPGAPTYIPEYSPLINKNALEFHGLLEEKEEVVHKWGKEKSDSIGVRKNYLEKSFYQNIKTNFDYQQYVSDIKTKSLDAKSLKDIYDIKHQAYFDAWDHGMDLEKISHVTWNDSNGLFLNNIDDYFNEFQGSTFVHPIRDIFGYISSEKTRITRRFYGSRRFQRGVKMPNFFVKNFHNYDINALIRCWNVSVTRAVLLQEKYGVDSDFIVYRYENLLTDTETVMKYICEKNNIEFTNNFLNPTLMGESWGGNSHQGKQDGVNANLASYYDKVLSQNEIDKINANCGKLVEYLSKSKETPIDLTKIPKHFLFDYDYQKKYFVDNEKMSLYLAFAFSNMRKVNVMPPNIFSIMAFAYSKIVRIMHIPRIIKLNLFPGIGRQNYT